MASAANDSSAPDALVEHKPKIPVLTDVTRAVADQVRRLDNCFMATAVESIICRHQEPKAGNSVVKQPELVYRVRMTDGSIAETKKIVLHGPAVWFNAFGPLLTQMIKPSGSNFQSVVAGKTTKMVPVVPSESVADDAIKRATVYSPWAYTMRFDSSKIVAQAVLCASLEGLANRLEIKLWQAALEYHRKYPGIIFGGGDFDLPDEATMLATAAANGVPKAPEGALIPTRMDTRCDSANSIPVHVPFVQKLYGVTADKSLSNIRYMKETLASKYADVIKAVFQDPDLMSLTTGGYESLLRSADTIRLLFTVVNLDVTRLSELFKSIEEKDVYVMRIPTIFGPSGEELTLTDLYDISYNRPVGLTPYIVVEAKGSFFKAPGKDISSVLYEFPRMSIIGYVPAQPIKVMSTLEESSIPQDMALAAVSASMNYRAPAIQAPPPKLAIQESVKGVEEEESQSGKRPHDEDESLAKKPSKRGRFA